jgi:sigma-B regulation protein RsbQ
LHDHKVPTLVLQCSDDIVAPVSAGEYIRRYIQNSTMVQLKATGHVPQMSAPRETVSAMWDYLYSSLS